MKSNLGEKICLTVFGESHGKAIGGVITGLPAGEKIDFDALQAFLMRRAPGGFLATPRKESDAPIFLSGLLENKTTGTPLAFLIENKNANSKDYAALQDVPRPSHADYPAHVKYHGHADMRGGGHFSGRLTAVLAVAGGIALQLLAQQNIYIGAHIASLGEITDDTFPTTRLTKEDLIAPASRQIPVISKTIEAQMIEKITALQASGDSIGGEIACSVLGMPIGVGGPLFAGLEGVLSSALFGIPAVKGVFFGADFTTPSLQGSQYNDPYIYRNEEITTKTNHHGGILGGISTGLPLYFTCAIKPTPSIGLPQESISYTKKEKEMLQIKGRHDPCILVRAVPVVEAVTAFVLLDQLYLERKSS
ncbi:MAG: chorismate synthase [Christensenellaceae bacterium]